MLTFIRGAAQRTFLPTSVRAHAHCRLQSFSSLIGDSLENSVHKIPHKEALRSIKQDIRWSYKELNGFVDELANGFKGLRMDTNDVIAIWLSNSTENLVIQFAAAKIGVTLAIMDPLISSVEEVEHVLQDSKAQMLIFDPFIAGRNQTEIVQTIFPELQTYVRRQEVFRPKRFRHLHSVISTGIDDTDGIIPFHGIMVNYPEPHIMELAKRKVNDKTPYLVNYSKSEKRLPRKSELLTQGEAFKQAQNIIKAMDLSINDKILLEDLDKGYSFAPIAAACQSSLLVIPAAEPSQETRELALKVEPCTITARGAANFQRISA
uniref:Uncharacterized protein AlNc14C26G2540 n=1 Tax=Albugo laibachii Nc14 TaxID=890382 RepID=F0W6Q4_9STRA|nr:conserved hypothetical protein [Albugo laibachii Nc14]|eukprot:CCA16799.1 conserved hypothetical protein [Albugo laibachii Nc14]